MNICLQVFEETAGRRKEVTENPVKATVCVDHRLSSYEWEKVHASVISQLDAETVFSIWAESPVLEEAVASELNVYFQKLEVPEFVYNALYW